jgi:hypothetical protein
MVPFLLVATATLNSEMPVFNIFSVLGRPSTENSCYMLLVNFTAQVTASDVLAGIYCRRLRTYATRSESSLFAPTESRSVPYALWQSSTSMSFLSVEPQSRVVLENFSNSLLAEFDSQLRIIADRYLAFFQERSITKPSSGLTHDTNCAISRRDIEET